MKTPTWRICSDCGGYLCLNCGAKVISKEPPMSCPLCQWVPYEEECGHYMREVIGLVAKNFVSVDWEHPNPVISLTPVGRALFAQLRDGNAQ